MASAIDINDDSIGCIGNSGGNSGGNNGGNNGRDSGRGCGGWGRRTEGFVVLALVDLH
jgi:hypothetical protein